MNTIIENTIIENDECVAKKPKIRIEQYYDGFAIFVNNKSFSIDQEDTAEKLVDFFKEIGFESEYELVY